MSEKLQFAIGLAKRAGDFAIENMDKVLIEKAKKDKRDIVTNIDLEIEKIIRDEIKQKYPQDAVYGEEYGRLKGKTDYFWIIDPICGTKYYIHGIKLFDVSIALWKGDEPIIGVVYMPGLDDIYYAEKNNGAFCNNDRITVSGTDDLAESIIYLDAAEMNKLVPDKRELLIKRLERIFNNAYRVRMFGLGGFGLCFLAKGFFEAYFDLTGKEQVLDIGAGIVIAQEAGAKITGLDGKFHGQDTGHIVATNGKIHKDFLRLLNTK